MGLWDTVRQASSYLRRSLGPDSYSQYKRGRKQERRKEDDAREHAKDFAERERAKAKREREYEERYTRERKGDIARERTERAEEIEPDG